MDWRSSSRRMAPVAIVWMSALALGACGGAADGAEDLSDDAGETGSWDDEGDSGVSATASTTAGTATGLDSAGEDGSGDDDGTGGDPTDGDPTDGETGEESESSSTGEPVCNDQDPVTLFLSPDDSNSMSSPVQVRQAVLNDFDSLSGVPIRPWEFFNYYSFDYPAADPGSVVVTPSMVHDETDPEGEYVLQIGVSSEVVALADRPPINITFVLDTSGSMAGHPIAMSQEVCRAVASVLREGDIVSMVTWDSSNNVVLSGHAITGPNDPTLVAAIDDMTSGGSTDLHSGLTAGYGLASANHQDGMLSRVLLISDGGANTGITDIDIIAMHAGANDEDGIYMVGVGVGEGDDYNDELMDDVTDAGKGASLFIPTAEEAQRWFADGFMSTMAVAARDVQVKLDMPPGFEIVTFSGEEYSADPAEVEPQHLAPNDAVVFHQRIRTCAPELVEDTSEIVVTARFQDAITFEAREVSRTTTFAELLGGDAAQLRKGAAVFGYVEALKAKRDEEADAVAKIAAALALVEQAEAALPGDSDLAEIRTVLEAL